MTLRMKNKAFILISASIVAVVFAVLFFSKNNISQNENTPITLTHSLDNFKDIKTISSRVHAGAITIDKTLSAEDLQDDTQNQFTSLKNNIQNYTAAYRIEKHNYHVTDIQFRKFGNSFNIYAEGLEPAEVISLYNNNDKIIDKLPSDWSGKLETLANVSDSSEICFIIGHSETSPKICHYEKAQEGQVL